MCSSLTIGMSNEDVATASCSAADGLFLPEKMLSVAQSVRFKFTFFVCMFHSYQKMRLLQQIVWFVFFRNYTKKPSGVTGTSKRCAHWCATFPT